MVATVNSRIWLSSKKRLSIEYVQIQTIKKPEMIVMLVSCLLVNGLAMVAATRLYEIETSGLCTSSSSGAMITDKAMCEAQAAGLGLVDTTATTMAMSPTLPGGCIFVEAEQKLYVFDSNNANKCTTDNTCLCAYTAPECLPGVNEDDCICGNNICTNIKGLLCSAGACSHPGQCMHTNTQVCHCGLQDCTPTTGLLCSAGVCTHAAECENRDGTIVNPNVCQCGLRDCVDEYCNAGTCRTACPAGKYVTSNNKCEYCLVPGYFCPSGATQSPTSEACPSGTYSDSVPIVSVAECKECRTGKYALNKGNTNENNCLVCPANMYQDETGQSSCKGCLNATIIIDTTDAIKHDSLDDCVLNIPTCLPTEYVNTNNVCTSCQAGFQCDGTSMTGCRLGSYCTGSGQAEPCPSGKYGEKAQQQTAESACTNCDKGMFQTVPGQTYCTRSCPLGTYGSIVGGISLQEACTPCPIGTKCGTLALQSPSLCPLGSFQAEIGQSECKPCPLNTFNDKMGMTFCQNCTMNEQQHLQTTGIGSTSSSQCLQLDIRCTGAQRPVNNVCQDCLQGFYSNGLGTHCILCPSGFFQSEPSQYKCNKCSTCTMVGSSSTDTIPFEFETNLTSIRPQPSVSMLNIVNIAVYFSIGCVVLLIVSIHRGCPSSFKHLDLFFSGDHSIDDTHARRILNTRLGASLTLCVPLIMGAIAVFVFTDDNMIEQFTLVPSDTVAGSFNSIYFEFHSFFANKIKTCTEIQLDTTMNCTQDIMSTDVNCIINMTCSMEHSGTITFKIPDNQQWATLLTYATPWVGTQDKYFNVIKRSGTKERPTVISYGARKCKYVHRPSQTEEYGVQLHTVSGNLGRESLQPYHYTQIQLRVAETLYLHVIDNKIGFVTQLSTVLTLLISVLGSMHTMKLCLEKTIDHCYIQCCSHVPADIQRRQDIFNERSIEMQTITTPTTPTVPANTASETNVAPSNIYHTEEGQRYKFNPLTKTSEWIL
jgi:hypothetical protein